jgi:hypothetical protein
MAHTGSSKSSDSFIIDTGCIGAHVFKNDELLTRVVQVNPKSHEVKDFSGNLHPTTSRGYLFNTNQSVLVMPNSKVNLLSTEQMLKDKSVSFVMSNSQCLIMLDDRFQPVLKAVNKGNGAYVCTAEDLRSAFGSTRPKSSVNSGRV